MDDFYKSVRECAKKNISEFEYKKSIYCYCHIIECHVSSSMGNVILACEEILEENGFAFVPIRDRKPSPIIYKTWDYTTNGQNLILRLYM